MIVPDKIAMISWPLELVTTRPSSAPLPTRNSCQLADATTAPTANSAAVSRLKLVSVA